jgi:excisionase family DNA binding protein
MRPPKNPELVSAPEAARLLGISRQRVHILAKEGSLESLVRGRHLYITKRSLSLRRAQLVQEENMLTADEAARVLGVETRRIYKWVARGRLPFRRTKQRRLLFDPAAIAKFTPPANGRPRKDDE